MGVQNEGDTWGSGWNWRGPLLEKGGEGGGGGGGMKKRKRERERIEDLRVGFRRSLRSAKFFEGFFGLFCD